MNGHRLNDYSAKQVPGWKPARFMALVITSLIAMSAGLGVTPVVAADEDDPNKLFDQVYGDAYKAALASTDRDDDIELANQLRNAVTEFELPKSLLAVMGERVCTLAERAPEAVVAATAAIDKIIEKDPSQKSSANARLITVLQKAYALGRAGKADLRDSAGRLLLDRLIVMVKADLPLGKASALEHLEEAIRVARVIEPTKVAFLESQLDNAKSSAKMASTIDALEKKLEADPTDVETRKKLVEVHLVQRDAPDSAVWFNGDGLDATTRSMLPIAAKDGAGASPKQLSDLAEWYMDVASDAADEYKSSMYHRSKKYYERFLDDYDKNDLMKAKATLSLAKIDGLLKKMKVDDTTASNTTNPLVTTNNTGGSENEDVGKLTVKIDIEPITEPDRVGRLFDQYGRVLRREYLAAGDGFLPVNLVKFNRTYPSSRHESVASVTKRLTTIETVRDGIIVRRIARKPVPAEAQAIAMALPDITPGNYGYVHSAEVTKIISEDEVLVKELWLVDYATFRNADYRDRTQRYKLYSQQRRFDEKLIRIVGHPTAKVTVGQRIGMVGGRGKPLQLAIVKLEPNPNPDFYNKTRIVAVDTSKLTAVGISQDDFIKLIKQRNLTQTDIVNIVRDERATSAKDYIDRSIRRIESGN